MFHLEEGATLTLREDISALNAVCEQHVCDVHGLYVKNIRSHHNVSQLSGISAL